MSNKNKIKLSVRVACIALAALMVLGVATTTIFVLIDVFKKDDKKNDIKIEEQIELASFGEEWTA